MAKTFGELKEGDILYRLKICNTITGCKKGNSLNAYKLLRKDFETTRYPSTGIDIDELEIVKIVITSEWVYVYYCVGQWTLYERFDTNKSSEIFRIANGGYGIYSTTEKELLSISKDVVFALREVERNNYLETDRRYREILKKLEKL